jgi:hypothetical protein
MHFSDLGFDQLHKELDCWQSGGRECGLWWRDDDLVGHTPQFERLEAMSQKHSLSPLVSVIPQLAEKGLGSSVGRVKLMAFCQHGLSHLNHESVGKPQSEFGAARPLDAIERDFRLGSQIMGEIFGERFFPVFVPPWNAITDDALALLPRAGFVGLSQYGPRRQSDVHGVRCVNTHLDIINWSARPDPQIQPAEGLAGRFSEVLQLCREGRIDVTEPLGILTHHRVMDRDAWNLMDRLFSLTKDFTCVTWMSPIEVFLRK